MAKATKDCLVLMINKKDDTDRGICYNDEEESMFTAKEAKELAEELASYHGDKYNYFVLRTHINGSIDTFLCKPTWRVQISTEEVN